MPRSSPNSLARQRGGACDHYIAVCHRISLLDGTIMSVSVTTSISLRKLQRRAMTAADIGHYNLGNMKMVFRWY